MKYRVIAHQVAYQDIHAFPGTKFLLPRCSSLQWVVWYWPRLAAVHQPPQSFYAG